MPLPDRPWPAVFALAYRYLDAHRRAQYETSNRTFRYHQASGEKSAIRNLAMDVGLDNWGTVAQDVVREMPVEPGPDWLDAAATELTRRLRGT